MRYMCLVYVDRDLAAAATEALWREIRAQCLDYNEALKRSGHYVASSALAEPHTGRTLRRREGKLTVTDGPFAETKEHLGGFFIIEAGDLEEALEIAGRSPMAAMGGIEVRATAGI